MRQRKLGLAAFLAVMLSLLMAIPAMATPDVVDQNPIIDVQVGTPLVTVQAADLATSTTGDPVTVEFADSPCNGSFGDTAITFDPSGLSVPDQSSCAVFLADGDGGPSAFVFVTFNIVDDESPPGDTINPVVEITSPAEGISVAANSVVINYTATDNVGINSCNVANGGSVSLTPGSNAITVNCDDAAGNVGSDTVNVIYDAVAPVVEITSPADGTTFTTSTTNITYTVSDNEDSSPTCDVVDGASVSLTEGANVLTVNCTDDAGNTGSDTVNVTYEIPVAEGCTVSISLGNVQVSEGDANHQIYVPVTLSNPCATSVTLSYSTQAKTADGSDYVAVTNQSITIAAGATTAAIPITIIGDNARESSEIFFVLAFSEVEGATLSKDKSTVVIQNDDKK